MSEIVAVPRHVAADYWFRPWSEVLAAAERGDEGLEVRRPHFTPWREDPPRLIPDADADAIAFHQKQMAKWEADQDMCFLYEADSHWRVKNKTLLYQQNWWASKAPKAGKAVAAVAGSGGRTVNRPRA
jgi:hypothetical protein